jgi:serine/threonine protein kinase
MRCLHCRLDGIPVAVEICPNCGVHLPSLLRDVLPGGTLLRSGGYRVDYALGRGGFGITYRARDVGLDMLVAIKEFYPQEHVIRNGITGDLLVAAPQREAYQRGLERFKQEGRILAQLNHHNVVRVHSLFEERDSAYLVMELIAGKTLRDELDAQKQKRLPDVRVEQIIAQLVSALDAVHKVGIYHLDIKPDNVLLMPDGKVVLVDFGAARQNLGSDSTRAYTVGYAAPEVIAGSQVGAESDIFELGMMLHEMLTNQLPPDALSRLINDNWKPSGLAEPWQSLITAALHIPKEKRPQSVRMWWERKIAATTPSNLKPDSSPSPLGTTIVAERPKSILKWWQNMLTPTEPSQPKVELNSPKAVDYTWLEKILAAGYWKQADRETAKLMLQLVGREKEGWLGEEHIKNFPAQDLRTIDQLWVKYSRGQFGFSVQKRIWESVGGQPGKYDYQVFCKLAIALGWRENNLWKSYSSLTFSLKDAPRGHLPLGGHAVRVGTDLFGKWRGCVSLLSRRDFYNAPARIV